MELAATVGINSLVIRERTPREVYISVKAHNRTKEYEIKEYEVKFENERKVLIYTAYLLSRWVWAKKVDIDKFLKTNKKQKEMTADEMLAQVKALNLLFGGEVIEDGTEK